MSKTKYLPQFAGLVLVLGMVVSSLFSLQAPSVQGQTEGETTLSGYAWSSNIGWINFRGNNYGVTIYPSGFFSGYAWSSNIGWINFAPSGTFPASPNHAAKLDPSTGQVTGWARALAPHQSGISGWDGWIKLAGNNYGVVRVAGLPGMPDHFRGYAWGDDVLGWMDWELVRLGGLSAVCSVNLNAGVATWSASVTGGTAPYNYQWTVRDPEGEVVQTGSGSTIAVSVPAGAGGYTGSLMLTDSSSPVPRDTTCQAALSVIIPPTITYPTLGTLNNQNNISIASQPLTSPAISSGITVQAQATSIATDAPLGARVLEVKSLVSGKSLIHDFASGGILAGTGNQKLPTCYWSRDTISPGASFSDCLDTGAISMRGGDQARFHIKIDRPVQAISDNNPYEVTIGDEHAQVSFLFDYRVATVNPI